MTIQGHTVLQKLGLGIKVTTQARQKNLLFSCNFTERLMY